MSPSPSPLPALITRYPRTSVVTTLNTDFVNTLTTWGHSYMDTIGGPLYSGFQIANKLFSALGVSWPLAKDYGQGGSLLTGDWRYMMRTARPVRDNWGDTTWQAKFGAQVFLYGANDVGTNGDPTFESSTRFCFLDDWANCWRAVFSYFRAGAVHAPGYIYGATTADHYATLGPPPVTWDTIFPGGKAGCTYTGSWASVTEQARKPDAAVKTQSNVTLSGTYSHNGVAIGVGTRVLVAAQSAGAQNGLYTALTGAWVRAADADTAAELEGAVVEVTGGTVGRGDWYVSTTGITLGSTAVTWSPFFDHACLGSDARQTFASGATIAVRLPPNFPGTAVTLYFAGEIGATGSTSATVTHGGTSPASPIALVTNDRVRSPSTYQYGSGPATPIPTVVPVRILGIPAGDKVNSQTITVNSGTLAAGHKLTFLGWTIEASHPPLLIPANIPVPGNWAGLSGYNTNGLAGNSTGLLLPWASYPQSNGLQTGPMPGGARSGAQAADTWCRSSYNPALATVATEFAPAGTVAVADLARVCDGIANPELYSPNDLGGTDSLHPNTLGRATIVKEFLDAMNRVPLDVRHLIAPSTADQMAEGAASLVEVPS